MIAHIKDILLIEDNPADAKLTMIALQGCNLSNRVLHLEDGEEALDYIFCKGKFADRDMADVPVLILLDLKMPKVSGIEVLKVIKSDARTKKIPVVVLTSSKEDPDIKQCYDLGANGYVVKPVGFDQFYKAISELGLYWLIVNQPPQ